MAVDRESIISLFCIGWSLLSFHGVRTKGRLVGVAVGEACV